MNYWILTDPHFNHKEMQSLCNRPSDSDGRIYNQLKHIPKEDILICLWDVCIWNDSAMHDKYIKPLQCKKILVKWNHDKKSDHWYLSSGWDFVCMSFSLQKFWYNIYFTHKPRPTLDDSYHMNINIHWHLHRWCHRWLSPEGCLAISSELDDYKVYTLQYHLNKIK